MIETFSFQELINKAQHIIHLEGVIHYICCCFRSIRNRFKIDSEVLICGHNICRCKSPLRMNPSITEQLKKIVRRKRFLSMVKEFGDQSPENRNDLQDIARALAKLVHRTGDGAFGNGLAEALVQGWL